MSSNLAAQISSIPIRKLFIKMELLDDKDNVVDSLDGVIIDGSISVDASSDIRRTCNLTAMLSQSLIPVDKNSKIWMDKKFKLYIGIENPSSNEAVWYNQGVFYFDQPTVSIDETSSTISFTGLDKVCWMDGNYGGTLGYTTRINAETPVFEAVKALLSLVGENKFIINDVENLMIPFDLEKDSSSTVLDFLCEIRDLYMGFEFFYDLDGYFVFQRIRDRKNDMVEWEFLEDNKLVVNYNNNPNWNNVKNKIIVWGAEFENKDQITFQLENIDDNQFGSKYIGERIFVVDDDMIQTDKQAELRAEYEMYLHSSLIEEISFDSIALYFLDVDTLIKVENKATGINGNYRVNTIGFDFSSGTMNVGASKMYY